MSDDDPATGRRFLTGSAYADDRRIRSRMAVFDDIAERVDQVIQAQGSFRAITHMGVFICS